MLLAAVFIGSQTCQPCHAAIFGAYQKTPMARSSGRVENVAAAEFRAAGRRYRIAGNRLVFEGGTATMDYFIGSNSAGRTYLHDYQGYLFELPVTWYAQRKMWDASPGYENAPEIRLTRAIEPTCLRCHSSRVRPVLGTQNRYGDPPFLEGGVACERCHGPGSEHVKAPAKFAMVNPAKLDAERRDAVCSQCHLTGEARVERPGRRLADFRPGDRLSDYATYFVWQLGRSDVKATSHVEKLAASACKKRSGGALWCGTCHRPHDNQDRTQSACLGCHAGAHRQQERCADCHMPRARAVDAGHGVMTDHGIPRLPTASSPIPKGVLAPFLGEADDRALGLAYAELGDPRARPHLIRSGAQDWLVELRLAALETDSLQAARHYRNVLRENPNEPAALVNYGAFLARQGQTAAARRLWETALVANPALEEAVLNLSRILPPPEAREVVRRYLLLNPVSKAAQRRLGDLSEK